MDGEEAGVDPSELDTHLELCRECRDWQGAAHAVTGRLRLQLAELAPEPVALAATVAHRLRRAPSTSRSLA